MIRSGVGPCTLRACSFVLWLAGCGGAPPPASPPPSAAAGEQSEVVRDFWSTACMEGNDEGADVETYEVECSSGASYTLSAADKSRRCALRMDGDRIVGGLCVVEDAPGRPRVASKVDCATGCLCTSGAGNCEPR